ncbi:hypothetical protein CspeluHIS016_0207300 [Cutaneotrichosporon spelunceum]|uniref:Uncharacterized protein n=1 Tax=Cutaneotrichosporon spelunceum TaxID=1672016 RepID=A0AAD3YBD5_9TREE|nr:hypothetical protein CspeluHIS016_0207300 [Cutaneotrichosporon spelunceum]
MPHPDAVVPHERARALSFNTFTSRPEHWDTSILCARTVHGTYIEQARRGSVVVRSEEFTLTPELLADLEAQQRLRASISATSGEAASEADDAGEGAAAAGAGRRMSEAQMFAQITAWRYDPANPEPEADPAEADV